MNELDLLQIFYDEMLRQGLSSDEVFLNVDLKMVRYIKEIYKIEISLDELEALADICIVNKWIERTTADPYYNFLSLTNKGLDKIISLQ